MPGFLAASSSLACVASSVDTMVRVSACCMPSSLGGAPPLHCSESMPQCNASSRMHHISCGWPGCRLPWDAGFRLSRAADARSRNGRRRWELSGSMARDTVQVCGSRLRRSKSASIPNSSATSAARCPPPPSFPDGLEAPPGCCSCILARCRSTMLLSFSLAAGWIHRGWRTPPCRPRIGVSDRCRLLLPGAYTYCRISSCSLVNES